MHKLNHTIAWKYSKGVNSWFLKIYQPSPANTSTLKETHAAITTTD